MMTLMHEPLRCPFCLRSLKDSEDLVPLTRALVEFCRDEHVPTCPLYAELQGLIEDLFMRKQQQEINGYPPPPYAAKQMKVPGNPDCVCHNGMQSMFCSYGHITECHYPLTCAAAECGHYQRDHANEDEQ